MEKLRRAVPVLLVLLAGFLVFQWNMTHFHLGYWLQVHTGTIDESGPYYGFWSGFGSDLGEYVIISSILGGLYHAARKGNCHTHGCWKIGTLPAADGYKVCRKCHLEINGEHPTIEHLKLRHAEKRARDRRAHDGGRYRDPGVDSGAGGGERAPVADHLGGDPGLAPEPPDVPGAAH